MVVPIGQNNEVLIRKKTLKKISEFYEKIHYEAGGIIGKTENIISEFQEDLFSAKEKYEYRPSNVFLMKTINGEWMRKEILFSGFVHSHLHNCTISPQDVKYAREILQCNETLSELLIGIVDLSENLKKIKWYKVELNSVKEVSAKLV